MLGFDDDEENDDEKLLTSLDPKCVNFIKLFFESIGTSKPQ